MVLREKFVLISARKIVSEILSRKEETWKQGIVKRRLE